MVYALYVGRYSDNTSGEYTKQYTRYSNNLPTKFYNTMEVIYTLLPYEYAPAAEGPACLPTFDFRASKQGSINW